MLITVASETGPDVQQLLDRPLWLTLYTYLHIQERRAAESLERRRERVDGGFMAAFAYHDPEKLQDELRSVHDAIEALDRPRDIAAEHATLRTRGLAIIERGEAHKAALLARGETPTVTIVS